jgi:hypothetical protein
MTVRRKPTISRQHVLEADLLLRSMGVRRGVRKLEQREPHLAEYLMEGSTRLYASLNRACLSHRKAVRCHQQATLLVLVCIEAQRRAT